MIIQAGAGRTGGQRQFDFVEPCSTSLGLGSWLPITTNITGEAGLPHVFEANPPAETRFYRVRVEE